MRNIKKLFVLMLLSVFAISLASCEGYETDYTYEAVEVGQLKSPGMSLSSPEFRQKYATLGRYAEPITITVAVTQYDLESGVKKGTTPMNQTFNQIAKDVLNIELKYTVIGNPTAYDQKLNLAISAGNMPDMFYTTNAGLYTRLQEQGALADLSDAFWYLNDELLDNYLTYFPELLPTVMVEGGLYAFPTITNNYQSAQRLYVRQDWLDIVGMEAPTTMEEFIAVGQAFVDNKDKIAAATGIAKNRVIPFTMNKEVTWAGSYSAEGFFNCFGTSVDSYFPDENGELYYSNTSPEMKAAVETLADMYKRGILDSEFITKSAEMIQANIKAGYVGMVFGEWWMAKDVLDDSITNIDGANWTWTNIPSAAGVDAKPIVDKVAVSGYNLVSKDCKHPEAAAKLINLFYDIYYNDEAATTYKDLILPSNGFYYQFVPIKLWDGASSLREYKRVQEVFDNLYAAGLNPADHVPAADYAENGILQGVTKVEDGDYLVSVGDNKSYIIHRDLIAAIEANPTWSTEFHKMRDREIKLHFADGYPYFVCYKNGKSLSEMNKSEKRGWGIYHEMVDPTGGYAYVVDLTEGREEAKYDYFYGASLSAMTDNSHYITTYTNDMFVKIITGQRKVSDFDSVYVPEINRNGGTDIVKQVNEWNKAHTIDYDYVYQLIER